MQRTTFILAFLFTTSSLLAQQYPFVYYTPREGLANNRARFIFQDSRGKLYISTFGGISIYDGTRFINYNTNNGLGDDLVNDIVEMGEDSIWILPNATKINCLVNGVLKDFIPADKYTPLINQLLKCSDGYYYALADEGLFRLEGKKLVKLPFDGLPGEDSSKTFMQAVEIDHTLYILSNPDYKLPTPNLLVYDLSKNKLLTYKKNIDASQLFKASENQIWVATAKGLRMLNKISEPNQPVTENPLPDSFHIPRSLVPNGIYRDRQNNIWLTCANAVYRITTHGDLSSFTTENGLPTNYQTSVFQDLENNMWFTNEQSGLSKLSNQQLAYYPELKPGYSISDIFIRSSSDSVWLYDGYHHRVLLRLPNGQTEEYAYPDESLPYLASFVSGNGKYMLSGNTIFRWNAIPGNKRYTLSAFYKDSANPIGFSCGIRDRNGYLVTVSDKLVVLTGDTVLSEPIHYMADQVTVDKDNRIWIAARSSKLFCFEISGTGKKIRLSLLPNFPKKLRGGPRSIAADKTGNIWIGTRDKGLFCLHFDNMILQSIRQLTTLNGLSENFVKYLYCDKDNNIWACTPSGLDKIRINNNNFLIENITRSSNLYLPILKIQQTDQGLFWILSTAGIITYDPVSPVMNEWKPRLAFSKIVISNAGHIPVPSGRELRHFQNNLVFQLSAPTYIDEKQTRFSYLLEGSGNENWSSPSTDASINFVNLSPGTYTLRARAIFLHGRYPDAESSYTFTVLPPWWQTWWFKLSSGLLVLTLVFLGLRYYINRRLELQRLILEKRRAIEKERTRIATDMHDDLGAGLSRIKFLSETIGMKKQQHLPIEEEISSIRTYSHEMIDKMGEIVWALNEKNDTLSDLLSYTRAYAVEYLEQNGIACRVEEPDNIPQDIVSGEFRRNIYLTVKEALHNIVKHAQATRVDIHFEITDWLSIQINDNGKGIDMIPGKLPGNGLFNMNTRVRVLQGNLEIKNNNGTQVDIRVPLNL